MSVAIAPPSCPVAHFDQLRRKSGQQFATAVNLSTQATLLVEQRKKTRNWTHIDALCLPPLHMQLDVTKSIGHRKLPDLKIDYRSPKVMFPTGRYWILPAFKVALVFCACWYLTVNNRRRFSGGAVEIPWLSDPMLPTTSVYARLARKNTDVENITHLH